MKATVIGLACVLWAVSAQAQRGETVYSGEDRLQSLMQSMTDYWQGMSRQEFGPSKTDKQQALTYLTELHQRLLRQRQLLQGIEQDLVEGMLLQQQQRLRKEPGHTTEVRVQTTHLESYQQAQVMLNSYLQRLPIWAQSAITKAEDKTAWTALKKEWQQAEAQWQSNQGLWLLEKRKALQNTQSDSAPDKVPESSTVDQ